MAEIEVIGLSVPEGSPPWFKQWATGANYKLLKLFRSITSGLTLKENLSCRLFSISVTPATRFDIPHNLGREAQLVTTGSGRIRFFTLESSIINRVSLRCWLASTVTVTTSDRLENRIFVADSSIFSIGDLVQISEGLNSTASPAERKIMNIVGNQLTLSDRVEIRTQKSIQLAKEVVTFLIL